MKKKKVIYKGKEYIVSCPGRIEYSRTKRVSPQSKYFQILDQLDDCKELSTSQRKQYLLNKYGLTEFEYYVIVVFEGDESKIPICSYKNPYTGEKCNQPRVFRSLVPIKNGKWMNYFMDGCKDHLANAATQVAQRENYKRGVTGLQKANRRSKEWRKKLSINAKKQIADGNSIFSPDDVRKPWIPKAETNIEKLKQTTRDSYDKAAIDIGLPVDKTFSVDELIAIDRKMFLNKGDLFDICEYYLVELENSNAFKLGVSRDTSSRIDLRGYHGYSYGKSTVLAKSTREKIAELEYNVKMEFKEFIVIGNEGFLIEKKEEILSFIQEQLKLLSI